MTPITFATPSPPKGRSPSFPTTLHVRSNIRSTSISMPSAISWNVASQNSSSSAASQPASKRPPEITGPSSLSQRSSYGCDKCPHHLVTDPQSDAAMDGVPDRLRAGGAVDEEVGDPSLGDAVAEAAAILKPALVSDRRHHVALAGHGGDDARLRPEGVHEAAIDVGLDAAAEQMRPLPADLDQGGLIGACIERGVERIERERLVRIALDPLPQLPDLDGGGDLVARRQPADPSSPAVDAV